MSGASVRTAFRLVGAFAVLASASVCAVRADTDIDIGTPAGGTGMAIDADRLGRARLFFTPGERAPGGASLVPTTPATPPAGRTDVPGKEPGRSAAVADRPSAPRVAHPRFQAVLRVGTRVRIVLGGRPCRVDDAADGPRCDPLPDGIRALALDPDGRRLLATFDDGRRKRFTVGSEVRP